MRLCVVLVLLTGLFSTTSVTADNKDKKEARKHFRNGLSLVGEKNLDRAVDEFRASYDLYPTKNALFNLATTYYTMQRYLDSLETFNLLSKSFGDNLDDDMKREVARFEKELSVLVPELTVEVQPGNAAVLIDGEATEEVSVRRRLLDMGEHVVTASLSGYEDAHRTVRLSLGEKRTEKIVLTPIQAGVDTETRDDEAAAVAPVNPTPSPEPLTSTELPMENETAVMPRKDDSRKRLFAGLLWAGVASTLSVGAATAGFLAASKRSADDFEMYDQQLTDGEYASLEDRDTIITKQKDAENSARTRSALSLGFGITTGVLAALTTTVLVLKIKDGSEAENRISVSPLGGVTVRF